jgi:hypothetical protein
MGLFFPTRRATHRRFSYEPRHYDPSKDDRLRRRIRIQSRRHRKSSASVMFLALLLALALYIIVKLS